MSVRLPTLAELEGFEHQGVIERYVDIYGVSEEQARIVWRETLKMLWLMVKHRMDSADSSFPADKLPAGFLVQKSMKSLDDMWHEFILFTREYHAFCDRYFGEYIHHVPCADDGFRAFQQRKIEQGEEFLTREKREIATFVRYILDHLGPQTLKTWFCELAA